MPFIALTKVADKTDHTKDVVIGIPSESIRFVEANGWCLDGDDNKKPIYRVWTTLEGSMREFDVLDSPLDIAEDIIRSTLMVTTGKSLGQ